jgi:predicted RNA binding protein YcfA (HicA-like mRNA interferase family)
LVRALERDGWRAAGQRGSHLKLRKPGHTPIIVAMHRRDTPKGTLSAILADAEISDERFLELLGR